MTSGQVVDGIPFSQGWHSAESRCKWSARRTQSWTCSDSAEPQPSLAVASQMQRQSYDILEPILLPEVAARCQKQKNIAFFLIFALYTLTLRQKKRIMKIWFLWLMQLVKLLPMVTKFILYRIPKESLYIIRKFWISASLKIRFLERTTFAPLNKTHYLTFCMSNSTSQYQVPVLNDIIHVVEIYSIGDGIH